MEIRKELPPNIEQIRQFLNPPKWAVFPYGDVIFSPATENLDPDIIFHEEIHRKQQQGFPTVGMWWDRYLTDKEYRKQCEVEAYGEQYKWWNGAGNKYKKLVLHDMAEALSTHYNLDLTYSEAEILIRHYT